MHKKQKKKIHHTLTNFLRQKQGKKTFDDYHKDLAKTSILKLAQEKSLEEFKDIVLSVGIVRSDGSHIDFIHPTFREYFAAKVFINWIEKESNELSNPIKKGFLLKEILMKQDYELIRMFMNLKLKKIIETKKLPEESLKQFGEITSKLFLQEAQNPLIDNNGKTILHIAFQEKNEGIIELLLKIIDINIMPKFLEVRDNNHDTVLYIAAKNKNDKGLGQLLEKVDKYDKDTQEKIILAAVFRKKQDSEDSCIDRLSSAFEKHENLKNTYDDLNLRDKYAKIAELLGSTPAVGQILNAGSDNNINIHDYLLQSVTKKGNNVLHKAARAGDYELVKWLVNDQKMNVNAICDKGRTALHKAARAGNLDIVKYLVNQNANPNARDEWNNTPLRDAIRSGKLDVVKCLFNADKSKELLDKDKVGRTALDDAAVLGHHNIVEWIFKEVNYDLAALKLAKKLAETEISLEPNQVTAEVKVDDDVNPENIQKIITLLEKKIAAVSSAASSGSNHAESSPQQESLGPLSADCCMDVDGSSSSYTRKKRSIWSCSEKKEETGKEKVVKTGKWHEVVEWLVDEKGADINTGDEFGRTILHAAAEKGNLQAVKFLLEHGANIAIKDKYDTSVLHFGVTSGNLKLVKWLILDKQVPINSQDKFGKSSLHFASFYGHQDIVAFLLSQGA